MPTIACCRLCGSSKIESLINFGDQPVVHSLLPSREAHFHTHALSLGICESCCLIQLIDHFPDNLFYKNYLTPSSWKAQPHASRLVDIINQFAGPLESTSILEVGCNDGSFLDLLKARGAERMFAFEPSKDVYDLAINKGYNIINDFFTRETCCEWGLKFDIIVSRQVFEHIASPLDFLQSAYDVLTDDGILVLEVPNFSQNLSNFDFSLWEEHITYYTPHTLNVALQLAGFKIVHQENTLFAGHALTIFALKSGVRMREDFNLVELKHALRYAKAWPEFKSKFKDFLDKAGKFYVYGAGARSCFLANQVFRDFSFVFVDDQPEKRGKFVPGCRAEIVPWSSEFNSMTCALGVNSESESRVISKRSLPKTATFSLLPPSRRLPKFWSDMI